MATQDLRICILDPPLLETAEGVISILQPSYKNSRHPGYVDADSDRCDWEGARNYSV